MARLQINQRGMGEMLAAPWMVADMGRRAAAVMALAESTAPVDQPRVLDSGRVIQPPHPGRYKASFSTRADVRPKSEDPPRAAQRFARARGRVENSAPEARHVEYGNGKTPAYATLRAALRAAG